MGSRSDEKFVLHTCITKGLMIHSMRKLCLVHMHVYDALMQMLFISVTCTVNYWGKIHWPTISIQ